MLDLAYHLFQQGRHAEAERLYRQALQRTPHDVAATNGYAFMLRHTGRVPEAIELMKRCLKKHPESVHLLLHLGEAYRTEGRLEEAAMLYKKVIRLRPNSAEALFCLGLVQQSLENVDDARLLFERAITVNPNLAEAHNGLAAIYAEAGDFDQAISHCLEAIRINPDYVAAHVSLGSLMRSQKNNLELAVKHFEIAVALQPDLPESYFALGQAWFELEEFHKAQGCLEKAVKMREEYPEALSLLAYCRMTLGNTEDARHFYERALTLSPDLAGALSGLTQTMKFRDSDDPLAARMLKLLQNPELDVASRSTLHFGLGKLYDDCGDYAQAYAHYHAGNELQKQEHPFDREGHQHWIDQLCATFDQEWFSKVTGWGNASEVPVFIVGMPRSGTTLTEQILAAHPDVFGAGELTYFGRLGARLFPGAEDHLPLIQWIKNIDQDQFNEASLGYLKKIHDLSKGSFARVTDKMPHNFLWLGLIAALFPNARIIHCRRDAMDNALSIYFQNFAHRHEYSHDLSDIGHHYQQYLRIMAHWREVLPGRILEVDYETTTADPEGTARRLLDFCGLPWNEACLTPQKTERAVRTASVAQVRQPIYRTSVQRWKHYEQYLDPLKEALGYKG